MMEERISALEAALRDIKARLVGHVPELPKPEAPAPQPENGQEDAPQKDD